MKKVYIIHGWGGNPDEPMLLKLRLGAEKNGFTVVAPEMPETNTPKIENWIPYLFKVAEKPDENTYFIGHSIGCQAIMRYLEKLPIGTKVGGILFIAGWFTLMGLEEEGEESVRIAKPWLETPIDFEKVKKACSKVIAIFSDDDPVVLLEKNRKIFEEKLNAKIIVLNNRGHFSEDTGVTELPEALNELLRISQ